MFIVTSWFRSTHSFKK